MNQISGVIKKAMLYPRSVVPSEIELTVELENGNTVSIREEGDLKKLQTVFKFEREGDNYNLSPLYGRKCLILVDAQSIYRFFNFAFD